MALLDHSWVNQKYPEADKSEPLKFQAKTILRQDLIVRTGTPNLGHSIQLSTE
jgi:hypothetical protein